MLNFHTLLSFNSVIALQKIFTTEILGHARSAHTLEFYSVSGYNQDLARTGRTDLHMFDFYFLPFHLPCIFFWKELPFLTSQNWC